MGPREPVAGGAAHRARRPSPGTPCSHPHPHPHRVNTPGQNPPRPACLHGSCPSSDCSTANPKPGAWPPRALARRAGSAMAAGTWGLGACPGSLALPPPSAPAHLRGTGVSPVLSAPGENRLCPRPQRQAGPARVSEWCQLARGQDPVLGHPPERWGPSSSGALNAVAHTTCLLLASAGHRAHGQRPGSMRQGGRLGAGGLRVHCLPSRAPVRSPETPPLPETPGPAKLLSAVLPTPCPGHCSHVQAKPVGPAEAHASRSPTRAKRGGMTGLCPGHQPRGARNRH